MNVLSDVDRDRLFSGDDPRWIGVTPPDGDYLDRAERWKAHCATAFAEAVIDGLSEHRVGWYRDMYLDAREQLRIARNAYDRMWAGAGRDGRFAGWLIRS